MFTGLVETMGTLVRRAQKGPDARLVISGPLGGEALQLGESIAVDGVCLTVDRIAGEHTFEVDASSETLKRTTLGELAPGTAVNLERAVVLGGRMGGHVVTGHVDGVGRVAHVAPSGGGLDVAFEAPGDIVRFIAPKGSITVSGVSLTVNGIEGDRFHVLLVPHTREKTNMGALAVGHRVNLEVDILARYVARLLEPGAAPAGGDASFAATLARAGYL